MPVLLLYRAEFPELVISHRILRLCRYEYYRILAIRLICFLFVWFDSLRPINNLSVIKGRVFLGWTSTKLGLMFLLKDTTHRRWWGSNQRPLGLDSSTLPLSHCAPQVEDSRSASVHLSNVHWSPKQENQYRLNFTKLHRKNPWIDPF